jgi:two-component sensor histidine kinase
MSVVFVLLLPLTTMLFMRLSVSLLIELGMVVIMVLMLYAEQHINPSNPILQNPKALFHLAYAAAIIYIFGLLYHFSILKTLAELDASNRQKELLLKEVHHRVKNNLNVIASIIGLQANTLGKDEKEQLMKSKMRIESIAMVHQMLYRSDDLDHIEFVDYVQHLSDLLLKMYGKQEKVEVEIESEVEPLSLDTMVQLGIMINELLTNSIKYAFGESGGSIRIEMLKRNGEYMFTYEDDGRGVSDTEDLYGGNSLGLKLIKLTARQLRGDVEILNPGGLKYIVRFKDG